MRHRHLFIGALLLLLAVLIVNTLRLPQAANTQNATTTPLPLDEAALAQRLSAAVQIATVSFPDRAQNDPAKLEALHALLRQNFPRVHAAMQLERIEHSLLYTWHGSDDKQAPLLMLGHIDVVPVEPGTENRWTHPAFSGAIADGYIWGRGTLDDKSSVVAWLEAAELLLAQGYTPARTIYFAFGHDEEIGGNQGAKQIAATLAARGVKAEFSLDEGGIITQGIVAGVLAPVASIMTAEKGYVSFRLTSHTQGGHSSLPPAQTAVGSLAQAVARVQNHQMPAHLVAPVTDMLTQLAPEFGFGRRLVIANRWLFSSLIARSMSATPVSNALVRTTTAPTMLRAGIKDNVLPSEAYAVINFRLLPGDTVADVQNHLREVIDDDAITLAIEGEIATPASAVSPTDSPAYLTLAKTIQQIFPAAVVTPGIVTGATDNRHYAAVYQNRYNFMPVLLQPDDLARIHGTDERIGVHAYADMVRFYVQLLKNTAN